MSKVEEVVREKHGADAASDRAGGRSGSGGSGSEVHTGPAERLARFDVNACAARVRVFAVKGRGNA